MTYLDIKYAELAYSRRHGLKTLERVILACIEKEGGGHVLLF